MVLRQGKISVSQYMYVYVDLFALEIPYRCSRPAISWRMTQFDYQLVAIKIYSEVQALYNHVER